ncbi:MAG: PfkB family carbohydrate kinase, partial [Casimicrobiaceae bacterium]
GYPSETTWLPLAEVSRADAVHADSRWRTGALALFDAAAAAGKPSVFDGDSGEPEEILRLSRAATHPFLSEPMLARYDSDPEVAVQRIFGGRNVAAGVTLGGEGVLWFDGRTLQHSPAFKVPVVDTLAAGDTWHGALAIALGEGQSVAAAIRFATAAAALKCTRFGGREGIPHRPELERFLAGH